jgi:SAM-dependent methyltransferase
LSPLDSDSHDASSSNDSFWNEHAKTESPTFRGHYQRQVAEQEEEFVVSQLLPKVNRVLEVGPGLGRVTRHLEKFTNKVVVCDISSYVIEQLEERFNDSPNVELNRLALEQVEELPDYGLFDAAVAIRTIPYVENWTAALRTLRNAVRPGGIILFDLWCRQSSEYFMFRAKLEQEPVPAHRLAISEIDEGLRNLGVSIVATYKWGYPRLGAFNTDFLGSLLFPNRAYSTTFCCKTIEH